MFLAWRDFIPSETNCPINRKLKCNVNVIAQVVEIHLQCRKHQFNSWVRKNPWRRDRLPTPVFMVFVVAQLMKNPTCNAGDLGSISGLGRTPGEGKGYPLEYSGLENSMDCIVHGVAKSWTRLSNCHSLTDSLKCYSVHLHGESGDALKSGVSFSEAGGSSAFQW